MEQKVILHSSRPSLLTCVGEALTSVSVARQCIVYHTEKVFLVFSGFISFSMALSLHPYVSIVSQCIHSSSITFYYRLVLTVFAEDNWLLFVIVGIDSRYFDHYETPDDVCVVDLDCNTINM